MVKKKIVITPKLIEQANPDENEFPKLGRLKTEYKLLSELNPAPYNPRTMTDKARRGLSNNIDEFGLVQPIVWNRQTGNIVGGHQRFEDLKKKKVEGTDVVVVDLSLEKEKKLNMLLNNKHIEGSFTEEAINILREIEANEGLESYVAVQLDGLEAEIAKTFNLNTSEPEFIEGGAGDVGIGLGSPSPEDSNGVPEQSHVKQVQLFLTTETYPEFMEMISHLQKKYMTDNPTDTVMAALKDICA